MGGKGSGPRPHSGSTAPNSQVPANNHESILFSLELLDMPAIDISDPDAMRERAVEYFDLCDRHHSKVLISGLCMALGFTREDLLDWSKGRSHLLEDRLSPESASVLQKLIKTLELSWEFAFQNDGYRNPVTGIFLGKNNFNYKDESQTVVKHEDDERGPSRKQLEEKYSKALPQEAEDVRVEPPGDDEERDPPKD
jgi:hypothetical protein